MLKLVGRGGRTKTAKVWRAPYVKGPPVPETLPVIVAEFDHVIGLLGNAALGLALPAFLAV